MLQTEEAKQRLGEMRMKLITSLVINALAPLVLYLLLRPLFADDVAPLVIAGAVPAGRTIIVWIKSRRVEWIGAYAMLGFAVAVGVSALSGGNPMLLKIHEQLLTGTVGLVLMISALMNKPLLQSVYSILAHSDPEQSRDMVSHKRITVMTAILGLVLLADAGTHVILAVTLPTATFLVMSRAITFVVLGGGVAIVWWIRQRVGRPTTGDPTINKQGETE